MNRINVEVLESRVLLSSEGLVAVANFDFVGPHDHTLQHASAPVSFVALGPAFAQSGTIGNDGMSVVTTAEGTALFSDTPVPAATPADLSPSQQGVVVIETVVFVLPQRVAENPVAGYPAYQSDAGRIESWWGHGEGESSNPTKLPQDGVSNQNQAQAPTTTGQITGAVHENDGPLTVVVEIAPGFHHSFLHSDSPNTEPTTLPPVGPDVEQHLNLTLLPAGTPVTPQAPVIVQQNVSIAPRASVPAAAPVVTPLALTPSGVSQASRLPEVSTAPATQVLPAATAKLSSAASTQELSQGLDHTASHWLGSIGFALGPLQAQELAVAASNAVEMATGSVNVTGSVAQDATALIAGGLTGQTLPASAAFNFIHFDAAAFHDAASVFANEIASMTGAGVVKHSSTRAWLVTGAVLGFDAVFLGYCYRKGKRLSARKAAAIR